MKISIIAKKNGIPYGNPKTFRNFASSLPLKRKEINNNNMKTKKMKRMYMKPSMKVYELKQRYRIMAGSLGDPDDYQNGGNPFAGN